MIDPPPPPPPLPPPGWTPPKVRRWPKRTAIGVAIWLTLSGVSEVAIRLYHVV